MAITDIFNRDKKAAEGKKALMGKTAKKAGEFSIAAAQKPASAKRERKNLDKVARVLKSPHVTEKSTNLTQKNQYVFKVWDDANKIQIKNAVQDFYGVDVTKVNVARISARIRKRGKGVSIKQGYKKAIVTLKEGQTIEVLPR